MGILKAIWNFGTSTAFQWIALSIGFLGTLFGITSYVDGRRKDRVYKFLFEVADKNIDKTLTDKQIEANKKEAIHAAEKLEDLREKIETQIPLEAKRAVLRDRIDANIVILQDTLASTIHLKKQLSAMGTTVVLPSEIIAAVESEILPEYVIASRQETLKSYLIVIMAVSALVSALVPGIMALVVQIPIGVIATAIVIRLSREYAAAFKYEPNNSYINLAVGAICTGALTAATIAFWLIKETASRHVMQQLPSHESNALLGLAWFMFLSICCALLVKIRTSWFWWILIAISLLLALFAGLLSLIKLFSDYTESNFMIAYVFTAISLLLLGIAVYIKVPRRRVRVSA